MPHDYPTSGDYAQSTANDNKRELDKLKQQLANLHAVVTTLVTPTPADKGGHLNPSHPQHAARMLLEPLEPPPMQGPQMSFEQQLDHQYKVEVPPLSPYEKRKLRVEDKADS